MRRVSITVTRAVERLADSVANSVPYIGPLHFSPTDDDLVLQAIDPRGDVIWQRRLEGRRPRWLGVRGSHAVLVFESENAPESSATIVALDVRDGVVGGRHDQRFVAPLDLLQLRLLRPDTLPR